MLAQGLVAQGGGPGAIPRRGGGSAARRSLATCSLSQFKREPFARHSRMTPRASPLASCIRTPPAQSPKGKRGLSDGDAMDVDPMLHNVTPRERHAAAKGDDGNTEAPGEVMGRGTPGKPVRTMQAR